jgi:hypothetical protein
MQKMTAPPHLQADGVVTLGLTPHPGISPTSKWTSIGVATAVWLSRTKRRDIRHFCTSTMQRHSRLGTCGGKARPEGLPRPSRAIVSRNLFPIGFSQNHPTENVLRDGRTGKDSKTAAGSALSQRPDKKKK